MPTTFLSLPPELRNYIYNLSGCLQGIRPNGTKWALWINRSSDLAKKGEDNKHACRSLKRMRMARIICGPPVPDKDLKTWDIGDLWVSRVAQPELSKASKQVRCETLPVFYGSTSFFFTLMDVEIDGTTIRTWLGRIGKENAASLRDMKIVYRKKAHGRYIAKDLMLAMGELGLRIDQNVVVAKRLEYPFCYCECCIRHVLGEM